MYKCGPRILVATLCIVGILQGPAFAKDSDIPDMPYPRIGMCSARIGNTIYFIGGAQSLQGRNIENLRGTSTVQAFDFKTMTWRTNVAPLQTPRVFACAVALNDSIYVMGGADSMGNVLSTVEVYDPSTNSWHYTVPMKLARKGAAATAFGDNIFVFGGGGMMGQPYREVEEYSVKDESWSITYSMIFGRAYHKVFRVGNSIYIFGGNGGSLGLISFIERYVPLVGPVQVRIQLNAPRMLFGAVENGESVYVISGSGGTGRAVSDIELLDLGTEGAERDTVLNQNLDSPRIGFVAAAGETGEIYLFGGFSSDFRSGQYAVPTVNTLDDVTSVNQTPDPIPTGFKLEQNYPNPFNPTTNIRFDIPSPGSNVSLDVYNMLGQKIKALVSGYMRAGSYVVPFDGANLASGTYIYRLQTENGSLHRKMVLIK